MIVGIGVKIVKKRFCPEDVAKLTGVGLVTIYREMQRGNLSHFRVGKRYIITLPDLEEYIGKDRLEFLLEEDFSDSVNQT